MRAPHGYVTRRDGPAERRAHDYRYVPLEQATIEHTDVVLHIPTTGSATSARTAASCFATVVEPDVPGFDEASAASSLTSG